MKIAKFCKGIYYKQLQQSIYLCHKRKPQPMSLPSINFLHLTVSRDIAWTRFYRSMSLRQGQRLNQHCTPTTPNQCLYQISTFYTLLLLRCSPDKILWVKVTTSRSKGKSRSHHDFAHLTPPNQCPYQVSTSWNLWFPRYSPDKILKVKVIMARSKVKSRSHQDIAHLLSQTNVSTKYQFPSPYGF